MRNNKRPLFRILDIPLITILIAVPIVTLFLIPHNSDIVTITDHGVVIYSGSLYSDTVITTESGNNTIKIENGKVFMLEVDCPDKTCVNMGAASPLTPVICLPNEVMIIIESSSSNGYDGVTY